MKVTFRVKPVLVSELLFSAFKPEEVGGHCEECGNHGRTWSCPPHAFDPASFLEEYQWAYILIGSVPLGGFKDPKKAIEFYYETRSRINRALLNYESKEEGSLCLYAGHCDACEPCSRVNGHSCIHPEQCRYSLESLGLKVSDITEKYFDVPLQWADGETPEHLLMVQALLVANKIETKPLLRALEINNSEEDC